MSNETAKHNDQPASERSFPAPAGSVQLSGELPMNRTDYDKLKLSGMMWEIYPDFTGDYDEDILSQNTEDRRASQTQD